jgi:dolichol-phosphate mannosyltransferase
MGSEASSRRSRGVPRVWTLLPAFNEALALPALLAGFSEVAALQDIDLRVLVVDDGSTDGSGDTAVGAARDLALDVLRHPANRGLGCALRSGFTRILNDASDQDAIVTLDADGSHPPELLPSLLAALEGPHQMVIASRYQPGASVRGVPLSRMAASLAARVLFRMFAPVPGVQDYTCGYRVYRAGALRVARAKVSELPREPGFASQVELLVTLARLGAKIREVPLKLRYDQKQSASNLRWVDAVAGNLRVLRTARRALREAS